VDIVITGRQIEVTPALKRFVNQRAKKIVAHAAQVSQLILILKVEKYRNHAEVLARVNGRLLRTEEETDTMTVSIDSAITKLERRLQRHTERRRSLRTEKKHSLRKNAPRVLDPSQIQIQTSQRLESMTTQEAESRFRMTTAPFFLFSDRESGQVHLLYRQDDATFGLITTVSPNAA